MSYVKCLCWFLGHAEQLLFWCLCSKVSISNYVTCDMSHFACHMSHCACHMSYVKCLCWSLGHAEQLLFSCVSSKVSICNYVTCHITHVTCYITHGTCHMSNAYVDSWDMLNNVCFDVYAQKWVFVIMSHVTFCMSHVTLRMSHVICKMLMLILGTCWTTFVLMSMLKSEYLWLCHMSHFACHMSQCACHMSYVKCLCLCWFLGHAEQLLFSCLYSKGSIRNYVTCHK